MPRMRLVPLVRIVILIVQIDQLVCVEQTIFVLVVLVVLQVRVVELLIVRIEIADLGVISREVKSELVTSFGRRRTTTARHNPCSPVRDEDRRPKTNAGSRKPEAGPY